jgi:hypothetical protein
VDVFEFLLRGIRCLFRVCRTSLVFLRLVLRSGLLRVPILLVDGGSLMSLGDGVVCLILWVREGWIALLVVLHISIVNRICDGLGSCLGEGIEVVPGTTRPFFV